MVLSLCACGNKQTSQNNDSQSEITEDESVHGDDAETESIETVSTEIEHTQVVVGTEVQEKPQSTETPAPSQNTETPAPPQSTETPAPPQNTETPAPPQNTETPAPPQSSEEVESESESEATEQEEERGKYLVRDQNLSTASLAVGDGMYDFTITTSNGETVMLSELLKEKDMVLLNFWATWCGPCKREFPYMSQAYNLYKDDVEIVALDIDAYDTQAVVEQFRIDNNLPFKVGNCSSSWLFAFGSNSIPTSVIIDRYGTICEIEVGAITSVEGFTSIFERYID